MAYHSDRLLLRVEGTHDEKQENKNRETIPNQNSKSLKTPKAFVTSCVSSTRSKSPAIELDRHKVFIWHGNCAVLKAKSDL